MEAAKNIIMMREPDGGKGAQLLLAAAARARGRALPLFGGLRRNRGRRLKLS